MSRGGVTRRRAPGDAGTATATIGTLEPSGDTTQIVALEPALNETFRARQLAITSAAAEASEPRWDGYGGLTIPRETIEAALGFARLLPSGIPEPEIGPSPRGAVTFDWYLAPERTLTVSVGPGPRVIYAGIFPSEVTGPEVTHGEIQQPVKDFPEMIGSALRRLYGE